jgi:tetratricopeptide (TPR) repeat protein
VRLRARRKRRRWIWIWVGLAAACGRDPAEEARQYLASGNRYAERRELKPAVIQYRNAVKAQPALAEAHARLGRAYLELGNLEEAYDGLSRAGDLQPSNAAAQLEIGSLLIAVGDFDGARTRARMALEADPENADAHILMASALAGLERLDEAVAQAERATRIDRAHAPSFTALGSLQLARGKRDEAERLLRKAIALDPKGARPRLALANFYRVTGDAEAAGSLLQEALEREPENRLARRAAAMLYLTTNRAAAAEPHLAALARGPNPADRLALADYYAGLGRTGDALRILEPLAAKKETAIEAGTRVASIQWNAGRREDAARAIDALVAAQPSAPEPRVAKARLLLMTDPIDAGAAIEQGRKAVKAAPAAPEAHYVLGLAQAAARQYDEADRSFAEVLRLNPRAAAAELQRSRLRLARGDAAGAVDAAARAAETADGGPEAGLQLARSLRAAGRLDQARRQIAALEARYGGDAAVRLEAGWIALAAKDRRAARAAFERASGIAGDAARAAQDRDWVIRSALEGLIAIDVAEGRVTDARARVTRALADTPDDPALLLLSGRVAVVAGALDDAERTLRRAIERAPDALEAYLTLAELYRERGRVDAARAEYERAASRRPDAAAPARTLLGLLEQSEGREGDAERQYRAALASDPKAGVAANNLAWMYAEQGKLDEALPLAEVAARELDRAEAHDTLGWVYLKKRLPMHAIPSLEKSVARAPDRAIYRYHLGLAYLDAGRRDRARAELVRALALKPDLQDARAALARLDTPPRPAASSGGSR